MPALPRKIEKKKAVARLELDRDVLGALSNLNIGGQARNGPFCVNIL